MEKGHVVDENISTIIGIFWKLLFITAVSNFLQLSIPVYSLQVTDKVIGSRSLETLLILTIIMVIFITTSSALNSIRDKVIAKIDYIISSSTLGIILQESILQNSLSSNEKDNIVDKNMANFKSVQDLLIQNGTSILDAPFAMIFLICLFFVHPLLGCVTLIGGSLLVLCGFLSKKLSLSYDKTSQGYLSACSSDINSFKT